jgi:hypothetical protein
MRSAMTWTNDDTHSQLDTFKEEYYYMMHFLLGFFLNSEEKKNHFIRGIFVIFCVRKMGKLQLQW